MTNQDRARLATIGIMKGAIRSLPVMTAPRDWDSPEMALLNDVLTQFDAALLREVDHCVPQEQQAEQGSACTECPYIFTEAEIASEDKDAWGHPCHGVNDPPGTVCESYRAYREYEPAPQGQQAVCVKCGYSRTPGFTYQPCVNMESWRCGLQRCICERATGCECEFPQEAVPTLLDYSAGYHAAILAVQEFMGFGNGLVELKAQLRIWAIPTSTGVAVPEQNQNSSKDAGQFSPTITEGKDNQEPVAIAEIRARRAADQPGGLMWARFQHIDTLLAEVDLANVEHAALVERFNLEWALRREAEQEVERLRSQVEVAEKECQRLLQAVGWVCDAADAAYNEDANNTRVHEIFNIVAEAAGLTRRLPDEHGTFEL